MISNEGSVLLNSETAFKYLLNNKTTLSVYLEDGTVFTGMMLGWDDVFLLIMENTILRMIQIAKINHLQADLNFSFEDLPDQLSELKPKPSPTAYSAINGGATNGGALTGSDAVSAPAPNPGEQSTKEHYKTRLDQLVRNW